jgi:hypothetical protein
MSGATTHNSEALIVYKMRDPVNLVSKPMCDDGTHTNYIQSYYCESGSACIIFP